MTLLRVLCVSFPLVSLWLNSLAQSESPFQKSPRRDISLDKDWRTIANDTSKYAYDGFEKPSFSDKSWKRVDVPHNWDQYEGYRRLRHGNRHGYAWYRKLFTVQDSKPGKRYFLFFEGVSSYATVWVNGKQAGYHAGGRTTFTLDVSPFIYLNHNANVIAVRADHPANIHDLPWVCGGCSDERGFSEGSQPMGIFRPVHLIITNQVRIEPFGVHIWNDSSINKAAQLYFETELKNYSDKRQTIILSTKVEDEHGVLISSSNSLQVVRPGELVLIKQKPPLILDPKLWNPDHPYLYKIVSEVLYAKAIDRVITNYGIRTISWPIGKASSSNQFLINGKPFFINGIAEYEHLIGNSHAFSAEQIHTRVMEVKAAGFNAFRDAHQPHNLRYQQYWDSMGILWWPQLSAHIWYDEPQFRSNFKSLLIDWIKERRNSPSVVLWGLQNESKLPEDFARECGAIIRQLDPTASSQRLITTCNGGSGTDWDVPQNWTGTYGGNPATYDKDIKKEVLVGEYGAWRTLDLHTDGVFVQNVPLSEDRMTQLMEMKIKLAEKVKDSAAGHFMWLLSSHENPGRVQSGEGFRELDRIGPINYKGLFTPWEEPTDAFYMFRANYASKEMEPMVYIVSHTWPDRWIKPGKKDNIVVYSNCDEVELFNDVQSNSLGKKSNQGIGTHFQWDGANIQYNVLYAVGYVKGKEVARDYILLNHLPEAPQLDSLLKDAKPVLLDHPDHTYNYIYRVNCGGPGYRDTSNNFWMADQQLSVGTWGSSSWTDDFPGMPAFYGSQRVISDPIKSSRDWKLFQSFRYGRNKLSYTFPLPDGEYLVELYFIEPWFGIGSGLDCTGWRLFDVAFNNKIVLKNLDIWKEAGVNTALKKTFIVTIKGGQLVISFPNVLSGEAVISAIAIASHKTIKAAPVRLSTINNLIMPGYPLNLWSIEHWANTGDEQYYGSHNKFVSLPAELFGAEWIKSRSKNYAINRDVEIELSKTADIYIASDRSIEGNQGLKEFTPTSEIIENSSGTIFKLYKRRVLNGSTISFRPNPGSDMYTIFVVPLNTMEPAYDLKPIISYKSINTKLISSGTEKKKVDGKDRIIFNSVEESALEWNITIGAADIYSLTISYNNPKVKIIPGKLQFISTDGTIMKEELIQFTPTKVEKLNYINSTTGTMINAGNYKVRVSCSNAEGLSIQSLDVQ